MPKVVHPALRFDGSAAKKLGQSGPVGLRKIGKDQPQVARLTHDKIDRLPDISVDSHRAVPLHLYYEAARRLSSQANALTAEVKALECMPDEKTEQISRLKAACDELDKKAHIAKRLGYARRTRIQQWMAKMFPKDKRETYIVASIIFGFSFNLLWVPYLIQAYDTLAEEAKKKIRGA